MNTRFSLHLCFLLLSFLVSELQPGCRRERRARAEGTRSESIRPAPQEACNCTAQTHPQTPGGEGMWPWYMLSLLDEGSLRFRGLEIPLQDLWKPSGEGLFQAVVEINGCTASFVSPQGLLLTNHHCIAGAIEKASTPEKNLLEEGFIARTREQEMPAPGLVVRVFKSQREITDAILRGLPPDLPDLEIARFVRQREQEAVSQCERPGSVRCQVFRESEGLHFWLVESLELPDVRLVLTLPDAAAIFGGDVDNWRWPRHSLDFAFLRAYTRPDGKPGAFSPDNIPHAPARFLAVSVQGPSEGDFIMVPGVPARTYRYRTAREVIDAVERIYPRREALFTRWMETLRRVEELEPESVRFHGSLLQRLSNARIHAQGQIEGITRNRLVARRLSDEETLRSWIRSTHFPVAEKALDNLNEFLESIPYRELDFLLEQMQNGVKSFHAAWLIARWVYERELPDEQRAPGFRDRDREEIRRLLAVASREYHPLADRMTLGMFLDEIDALPPGKRPDFHVPAIAEEERRRRAEWLEQAFSSTTVLEPAVQEGLLAASREALLQSPDPILQFALKWYPLFHDMEMRKQYAEGAQLRLRRPWMQAFEAFKGRQFYPDASGSPRVSFAYVTGYAPEDGIWFGTFTTLRGMLSKHRGTAPFALPADFLDSIQREEYGPWGDAQLDDLPVNFLGNADTSTGNSGSPVLDGKGRIIGLNFDRVFENIAGDFGYHPARSRNIMVDVRAILWYLDRHALARNLLEEMGVPASIGKKR